MCPRETQTHLVKHHLNRSVVSARRQPARCSLSARSGDIHLCGRCARRPLPTTAKPSEEAGTTTSAGTAAETAEQVLEKLPRHHDHSRGLVASVVVVVAGARRDVVLDPDRRVGAVVAGRCATAHEVGDHGGGVDGTVALGAAQGADGAGADLAVADDGRVRLGAAAIRGAVTRGAVGDWRSWSGYHLDTCGEEGDVPDRPGISTPLAPRIMVTTPWAEAWWAARRVARRREFVVCMLGSG